MRTWRTLPLQNNVVISLFPLCSPLVILIYVPMTCSHSTCSIRGQGTTEIGTVFITETYVCVQWAWLVCVAAQIMMSAVFVVGVMIQTSVWKVKVVKSSALATMLALNTEDKGRLERENMGQVTEPRTMSTRLRSAKAKFSLQEDGSWSLNLDSGHEPAG